MKKLLILWPMIGIAAIVSCSHHDGQASADGKQSSNSAPLTADYQSASRGSNFVHVAVVQTKTVDRIRTLLSDNGLKVQTEKILPEGGFYRFPPDTCFVSVPEDAKAKAKSLIGLDARKGKYWIQVQD